MEVTSLSIVIPALNEGANLRDTVTMLEHAVSARFEDYEFIIIDDGSQDTTGSIADELAISHKRIRVIHHEHNAGIGFSIREGFGLASKQIIGWIPADTNLSVSLGDLHRIVQAIGQADFVQTEVSIDHRPWFKRAVSRGFVVGMNLLFGLRFNYYNGANFYSARLIRSIRLDGDGYELFSNILVRLATRGATFVAVGIENLDTVGNSNSFHFKTFLLVVRSVLRLRWEVFIANRQRNSVSLSDTREEDMPVPMALHGGVGVDRS
ncbi:MAG: glycosyltransferase family 2 protein [Gemmatimonadetes bacterium]|jgi:glycosyltransferase involved in cell wall biosynthesis|nr:glycosyltransferase family 2 protein [Gemmatimonadota bacterium]